MIAQHSIQEVEELSISEVALRFIPNLKQKGANLVGVSPWNPNENTGSFFVSEAKNIAKCFSTGTSAVGGITLIMKARNLEYIEAVKAIADEFNIQLDYDSSPVAQEILRKAEEKKPLYEVMHFALEFYASKVEEAIKHDSRVTPQNAESFTIGFARNEWQGLINAAEKAGISAQQLERCGLAKRNTQGKYYDVFRNRIMFPIFNRAQKCVGFSGRFVGEADKKTPKYLNSSDNLIFNKGLELLGYKTAIAAMRQTKTAYLVEGNFDVTGLYAMGIENTVAPCGTGFTENQLATIKRNADTIVVCFDGDAAGLKAAMKAIEESVKAGLLPQVVILGEDEDPDTWARNTIAAEGVDNAREMFLSLRQDGVLYYCETVMANAKIASDRIKRQQQIEELLSRIEEPRVREHYMGLVAKQIKDVGKLDLRKSVSNLITQRKIEQAEEQEYDGPKLPQGASVEEYERYGFFTLNDKKRIGYYFPTKNGQMRATNFVMHPVMHIRSISDNKRLIEIQNHREKQMIDVSTKDFIKPESMNAEVAGRGNYLVYCDKKQYLQILTKLNDQFPIAEELKTLGWQNSGFYAFANGIFNGTDYTRVNENGIIMHQEEQYFLPAFSKIYMDVADDDDLYENDRKFKYRAGEVSFKHWAKLFCQVYGDNGKLAIAWTIAAIFRDLIYREGQNFPHLFLYGEKGSGKSTLGWSVNDLFFHGMPAFNLNSGTQVGMYRRLGRQRNAVVLFEEFSQSVDIKRFQTLKAAYDGVGYEKGVMSRDNRTEMTKVNSASIIVGQYLPTQDDNALFERSLLLQFKKLRDGETRKEADVKAFHELQDLQKVGMSHLVCEVLKHRKEMEREFLLEYRSELKDIKESIADGAFTERIVLNFTKTIVPVKIIGNRLGLPFYYEEIKQLAMEKIVDQTGQVNQSDSLSQFWDLMGYLIDARIIREEQDYSFGSPVKETYMWGRNESRDTQYDPQATKLLYLRLTKIVPAYHENARKQGVTHVLTKTDLQNYFRAHTAYEGTKRAHQFKGASTSAFVFNYKKLENLGVNLERDFKSIDDEEQQKQVEQRGAPNVDPNQTSIKNGQEEDDLPY